VKGSCECGKEPSGSIKCCETTGSLPSSAQLHVVGRSVGKSVDQAVGSYIASIFSVEV
jgi:hypothetical protein